jgi:hypothetical protein
MRVSSRRPKELNGMADQILLHQPDNVTIGSNVELGIVLVGPRIPPVVLIHLVAPADEDRLVRSRNLGTGLPNHGVILPSDDVAQEIGWIRRNVRVSPRLERVKIFFFGRRYPKPKNGNPGRPVQTCRALY